MSTASTLTNILVLDREDLAELLDLSSVMASQRDAFMALADGSGMLAPRLLLPWGDDVAFCYAARVSAEAGAVCKFGSVNPSNADVGLPTVSALVLVQDPATGRPRALLDGDAVTIVRTAAASVVAAQALSAPGADVLTIIGCGAQGQAHARAFVESGTASEIRMWSPFEVERLTVRDRLAAELSCPVLAPASLKEALAGASLVVTATTSSEPVLSADLLERSTTVLSVGSFAPTRREVDDDVIALSRVVVDDVETAFEHAGPIIKALSTGVLDRADVLALGEVLLGRRVRTSSDDIVFYNSVGLGIQDAAVSWYAVQQARERGIGRMFSI